MATLIGDITFRQGGSASQSDTGSEQNQIYLVQLASATESLAAIVAATGVPFGGTHSVDDDQLTFNCTVRPHNGELLLREVEFSFSTSHDREDKDKPNPLDRRIKIRWSGQTYQKFVMLDRNGDAIINKAGEFFEDVPGIDDVRWVIQVEQNVLSVPLWVLSYENKLNDAAVTIDGAAFDAETLKMQNLRISDILVENKIAYRNVSFELHYRSEGWAIEIANRGYNELNANGDLQPIKIPFKDANGAALAADNPTRRKPPTPWPLDSAGAAIEDPGTTPNVVLTFDVYKTANFSVLPGVT